MAVRQGAWFRDASHPAEIDRLVLEGLLNPHPALASGAGITSGVGYGVGSGPTELQVTQRAAGANMSVDVAAGHVWIDGSETGQLGVYKGYNDAAVNLAVSASHATLARKDLVVARVRDSEFSGATDNWALEVVTGTPATAGTEVEPAAPASSVVLAVVAVAASASSITNANITDRRRRVSALGGIIVCTSTTRPTIGLYDGLRIWETDTRKALVYNLGTAAWDELVSTGAWTAYTPTLTASGSNPTLGTGNTAAGKYTKVGRTIIGNARLAFGASGAAAGTGFYRISLPVTPVAAVATPNAIIAQGWIYDASANSLLLVSGYQSSTWIELIAESASTVDAASPWTWAASDQISLQFTYEAAS